MRLSKGSNLTTLERKDWATKNIINLIGAMTNLYMATRVKRDFWLTDKEYLFFICCVLIVNEGAQSYLSSRSRRLYSDILNISRVTDISGLLKRLSDKGWLEYDTKTKSITIPSFFTDLDMDNHRVNVEVEINYKS